MAVFIQNELLEYDDVNLESRSQQAVVWSSNVNISLLSFGA